MMMHCPELMRIVDLISSENPLQRKRIDAFLATQGKDYFVYAENLSRTLNQSLLKSIEDRSSAAHAYSRTCMDMVREQIRFRKTGKYLLESSKVAEQTVYSQQDTMRYYIVGLMLSYLFWPNHYEMMCFYREHLGASRMERVLEVGAGHGLFTAEVLRRFPKAVVKLIDISETSIQVAGEILTAFDIDRSRVECVHSDFMNAALSPGTFDFVILGEVLEHVNDAPGFLAKARDFLHPRGTLFLSTCVNAPAPDHIYHFHTVGEIRDLIDACGLRILKEQVLPTEPVPEDRWQQELVTVNYSGILCHRENA